MRTVVARSSRFLPLALTFAVLAVILYRIDWPHFFDLLAHQSLTLIMLGLACLIGQIIFLAARWDALINITHDHLPIKDTFRMTFISLMSNFVFLTSISGTILRLMMTVQAGVPWVKTLCASLTDRACSLFGLVVLGLLFSPFLLDLFRPDLVKPVFLMSVLCGSCALLVLIGIAWSRTRYAHALKKHSVARKIVLYFQRLLMGGGALVRVVLFTFAAQLCYFMAVFFLVHASGAQIGFFPLMMVLPLIAIVAALPVSAGGWGLREGAFILGLGVLGLSDETALLAALQIGVFGMVASLVVGLPCLFSLRLQRILKESVVGSVDMIKRLRKA